MKSLFYILIVLSFPVFLSAQDATQTDYKNQIGFDIKPVINGLSGVGGLFYETDILYRRKLSDKNWVMAKLALVGFGNASLNNEFNTSDTTYVRNHFYSRRNLQFQLNYSRQFLDNEKVNLYYGLTSILAISSKGATSSTQFLKDGTFYGDVFLKTETFSGKAKSFAIGPSFSFEWNMSNRFSLLINTNILGHISFGEWTYLDENLKTVTTSFNNNWSIHYLFLRDIAVMYNF